MGNVYETAGEVTGVGRLQGGIGKTLTGTVRRDKVLEHGHAFLKVRKNRVLNNLRAFGTGFLGLGHKTTHTGELGNLVGTTTGTRVEHHEHSVETLVGFGHLLHEGLFQVGIDVRPSIDYLIVTLVVGDETHVVVHRDLVDFLVTALHDVSLFGRNDDIVEVERQTAFVGLAVTEVLDTVEELAGAGHTHGLDDAGNDVAQGLLGDNGIDITYFDGDNLVDDNAAHRGLDEVLIDVAFLIYIIYHHLNGGMHVDAALVEGDDGFFGTVEGEAGAFRAGTELGDVVKTEHHILRGHGDRRTVGRVEDVVALKHEHLRLENGFVAEGKVNGHLVTVEVGVERGTCQRVKLNGLALNHLGLESLYTKTVKRRGTVEEHGVALHDVFEDIPNHGLAAVYYLLRALDGLDDAALDELTDNERLVKFGCHEFGQTAFAHFQFRTYNDYGTGGIVHTLTEEVLTETALLTFERVGKGLEGAVAVALNGAALAGVVEKAVDGFLKHTLFVAQNDFGGLDFQESLQAVVADKHAAIEVVEVGSGETAAIEGHERTQFGRRDRNDLHDHPLGTVAVLAGAERLYDLQALQGFGLALHGGVGIGTGAQFVGKVVEIDAREEVVDGLCTHLGDELVGVGIFEILVVLGQTLEDFEVFVLGEQVVHGKLVAEHAGLDHHVALIINNGVELLGGDAEEVAHLIGQGTEIPDVCHGHNELDVTGTLAAHLLLRDLYAASVADDALVANALVLAAVALVVLGRTEDALAEEAVALGLVGAVVDGFGFQHLTVRIGLDFLGRGQANGNLGEVALYLVFSFECHNLMYEL